MSETLLNEIRATRPEAPSALRERVRALSAQEPAGEPLLDRVRLTWGWKRIALAVPATLVVALLAAGVIGISRDDAGDEMAVSPSATMSDPLESFDRQRATPESSLAAPPPYQLDDWGSSTR